MPQINEVKQPTTCQICGRPVKSKTGVIAHHGYKRPGNGWQTSSCMGARHLPYEVSCDLIPEAIEAVKSFIERTTLAIEDMKVNPPAELPYTRGSWNKETTMIQRPADFKVDGYKSSRFGSYDTLFHSRIYDMEVTIRFANGDLKFMEERLANWKPPVTVEGEASVEVETEVTAEVKE